MDWNWIVEWTSTDSYGRYNEKDGDIKVFENKDDMNNWLTKMRDRNGGYFKELFIGKADVSLYRKKMSLLQEAEIMGELFEKSKIPWKKENP